MKKLGLFCLAALLIAMFAGTSYATIVEEWDATWDSGYLPTEPIFSLDYLTWDIVETGTSAFTSVGNISSNIQDECIGDPQFVVTLTVENSTGFTWTGYMFELNPGEEATFFGDASTSGSEFGDAIGYPDTKTIIFSGLEYVEPTELVTFNFTIDVPNFGDGFTLTQTPILIPEPATIALLGAGMLFLKRRSFSRERR